MLSAIAVALGGCGDDSTSDESVESVNTSAETNQEVAQERPTEVMVDAPSPTDIPVVEVSEPTSTPEPTSIPATIAPSYSEICGQSESLTEAQWNNLVDGLKGQFASEWTGWVEEVNDKAFGGFELWVDLDSPDEVLSVQDVQFDISDEIALDLQLDQQVTFSGNIDSITRFLGCSITLTNAEVKYEANSIDLPTSDGVNAPDFSSIQQFAEAASEAQWNQYSDSLTGLAVDNWMGWVEEVNEKTFGGFELWIDMASPNEVLSVQDVQFDVSDELALEFNIDQPVTFSGKIESATRILDTLIITLEDASVNN